MKNSVKQIKTVNSSNIRTANFQGPVVQSIVSLTSSLGVKMLILSTISNSQVFLLKKCE